MKMGLIQDN